MPTDRMHRGLVAISASAVAAIYMAGYLRTQSADASIGASAVPPATTASAAVASNPTESATATAIPQSPPVVQRQFPVAPRTVPNAQPTAPPARALPPQSQTSTAPQAAAQGAFKEGTYTGQGTSRRGDVWVSVQVQSGRIANVSITRSTLQYPLRDIAGLPAQVVQRQTAQVDTVSRATYSSQAFKQAVSQALSKAG
ncbi:MAG: FMN-binding protein [Chloroflexi bacterium]|nr:FMN-binding protein [Chloroflexota bacterium]